MENNKTKSARSRIEHLFDMGEKEIVLSIRGETNTPAIPQREAQPVSEKGKLLAELSNSINGCSKCKLGATRIKLVFGVGDPNAKIVFVGEAPGADEDRIGEPFVGAAGKLLDKYLAELNLSRKRGIYICNVLKCRPPGNRDPESDEVIQCIGTLQKQLEIIAPKVICCLGRISAQNLLETDLTLGKLREKIHEYRGIPMIVTYHPAYLLRNSNGSEAFKQDLLKLDQMAKE
jgi:uracil-DNA glycosylase